MAFHDTSLLEPSVVIAVGTYDYDHENRLITFNAPTTYIFGYDYRTRRVIASSPDQSPTRFIFSGGTSVQERNATTGALIVENIRGSDWGGGVGGLLYTLRDGIPSYTHYNSRGDVTAKTNDANTITFVAQYEAFGNIVTQTGSSADRQRSNTKDWDIPGYANEGFRFRDLETGTFLTRDPLGFIDGPNMYAYVVQNPWTKFDPLGLSSDTEFAAQASISWGIGSNGFTRPKVSVTLSARQEVSSSIHATIDANVSVYAGRMGTSNSEWEWQWDASLHGYATVGTGKSHGVPVTTLNRDTVSAFDNTFEKSIMYGGGIAWNSATGYNDNIVAGARYGDISAYMQNDMGYAPAFPLGDGSNAEDQGWTASASLLYAPNRKTVFSIGYEQFTGIPDYEERKEELRGVGLNYTQPNNDKQLNWGETYFSARVRDTAITAARRGGHWGQNLVHNSYTPPLRMFEKTATRGVSFDLEQRLKSK